MIKELSFDELTESGAVVSADGTSIEGNESIYLKINNSVFTLRVVMISGEEAQSESYEIEWNQADVYQISIQKDESGALSFSEPYVVK